MRITPLAIHEQTFRVGFRGFDPVEVDSFLQRVADEMERLIEERDALQAKLQEQGQARDTLDETLAAARSLQGGILEQAKNEAEVVVHQAQLRADRILAEANEELLRLRRDINHLVEKRSIWLAECSALASTLERWITEKAAEEIHRPELFSDPMENGEPSPEERAEVAEGLAQAWKPALADDDPESV